MDKQDWYLIKHIYSEAIALEPSLREEFVQNQAQHNPFVLNKVMQMLQEKNNTHDEVLQVVSDNIGQALATESPLAIGDTIDHFTVVSQIGEGGMGSVYLAKRNDDEFEQSVAVKVIHKHKVTPENELRFKRERQILAKLNHKNIASLIGGGQTKVGQPYILMEYVYGEPITEYCNRKDLNIAQRLALFNQVLSAISYAHQNLIIHRDIKPNNVLVTENGDVKLLDFGIAKLLQDEEDSIDPHKTQVAMRVLTYTNAAPEQILGEAVTTTTDVYGLGTLLVHMLTNAPVFDTGERTAREIEDAIIKQSPIKPSVKAAQSSNQKIRDMAKQISGDLDTIILKALHKLPSRRYASAEQFAQDIYLYLHHYPVLAKPDSSLYRMGKFVQRNRLTSIFASAFVLSLLIFTSVVLVQSNVIKEERDSAIEQASIARQTADYLSNMFDAADPNVNDGEVFTAKMLLDEAFNSLQVLNAADAIKVELMLTLSGVYGQIAEYDNASILVNDAKVLLDSNNIVGNTRAKLNILLAQKQGELQIMLGEYKQATESFESKISQLDKAVQTKENSQLDTALSYYFGYSGLATAYTFLDEDETSLAFYKLSIDSIKDTPHEAEHLAYNLIHYGHALRRTSNFTLSKSVLLEGIALNRKNSKKPSLLLAYALNQLASTMIKLNEFDEVLPFALEGLKIRQALLPTGHMEVVASMGIVSNIYDYQGKFDNSLQIRLESLELLEQTLGKEHPFYAIITGVVGQTYMRQGNYVSAESTLTLAKEMLVQAYSPEHQYVARYAVQLGHLYLLINENQKAYSELSKGISMFKLSLPKDHYRFAYAEALYAVALQRVKQNEQAANLISQALQKYKQTYPENTIQYKRLATSIDVLVSAQ